MTGRRTRDREPSKDRTGLGPRLTPRQARGSSSCPEPSGPREGSVRADEDRERAQFESRILEVLESFEVDGLNHGAQLPRGQWPLHRIPALFWSSSRTARIVFKANQTTSPAQARRPRAVTRAPALWTTAYPWRTIGIGLAQRGETGVGTRAFTTVAQVSN